MKKIIAGKNEAGQRLDKLLLKTLNKAPKSFVYKMLRKKNITLNGKKAEGSEILQPEDVITIFLADETMDKFSEKYTFSTGEYSGPEGMETGEESLGASLAVVYEDANILLVNKAAGMLSQKAKDTDISLVEHLIGYLLQTGKLTREELTTFRPGICNRLDRNTSGLVAAGKTLTGLQKLSELFRDRTIDKYYLCLVRGMVRSQEKITGYLKKDEKNNRVFISQVQDEDSDPIETEYIPQKSSENYTLLRVKLITGKTHQIRAHLSSIGHPIIGDGKYGNSEINRKFKKQFGLEHQLLHSYEMVFPDKMEGEFESLSGRRFQAPLPEEFEKIVKMCFLQKER